MAEKSKDIFEYTMKYKSRGIAQFLNFKFAGNKKEAIERGRAHCEQMRWRFIYVDPLFIDLDEQEDHYLKREMG